MTKAQGTLGDSLGATWCWRAGCTHGHRRPSVTLGSEKKTVS
eukprot:CAMPEP_0177471766 /NCGR_PEP_ID=MMETSP0369-20130122/20936_1 /TAXON_ID=447022 ORGANISM="Scrippsiella hangoei-like, Strain SHHI-4" /NCGR_SAMPLE_ID=MMETSP0369 /ASSEMBLY_ACC=CAM_ASM_000364 /LENGTH=41 /DNA_ID= /DNA_START= /DNA_END= /DNA_ORIENTATION=